jgi:xylulokinase
MMGAIGTGNVTSGKLTMSLGTSGTLFAYSDAPVVDPKGNIAAFCSSTGGWLPLLCTMNCTLATELVRAPLGIGIDAFDATIEPVPPGADGLLVLPFFTGERTPDLPKAKACFICLTPASCSKGHMLRATVEGATFALKFGVDELAALGLRAEEIVLTGGGANSRVWRAIVADICNLPVTVLEQQEGAAFGAALQALWALERQTSPARRIDEITAAHLSRDPAACTMPDAARAAVYAERYAAYQRAVQQVAPLFGAV